MAGQLAEKFGLSGAVGAEEFRGSLKANILTPPSSLSAPAVHEYEDADGKTVNVSTNIVPVGMPHFPRPSRCH